MRFMCKRKKNEKELESRHKMKRKQIFPPLLIDCTGRFEHRESRQCDDL